MIHAKKMRCLAKIANDEDLGSKLNGACNDDILSSNADVLFSNVETLRGIHRTLHGMLELATAPSAVAVATAPSEAAAQSSLAQVAIAFERVSPFLKACA